MGSGADQLVERGRAALRAGDGPGAREAIAPLLDDDAGARGDVLEILARSRYLDLDYADAIRCLERGYASYRAEGDQLGAIRVARTIAGLYHSVVGDFAVSAGWLGRAQTLLDRADVTSERGWVALNAAMFESDRSLKHERFREALDVARSTGDAALEIATLAYLGASLVHADELSEGMRLLDEALAAVAGDEVDDFSVLEEVFCQLFSACEHARDVTRADQWIRMGDEIAARRNLPAVSAFCRTHYGGVLTAAGRWSEADEALTEAARLWGVGRRSSLLRGGALVRLADLRVRQGRYEEAEQLLADLHPAAIDEAAGVRAAIHLARGRESLARDVLEGALERRDRASSESAPLLDLLVEVLLAAGELDAARSAVDELDSVAQRHDRGYLRALAALARGRLCVASGTGDARACLREAVAAFARAGTPLEEARTRLELAQALATDRPEVAVVEARAALDAFDALHAARHADAAAAMLRVLGVTAPSPRRSGGGVLSRREAEVLELVGLGLSNPEIAERLFISRKTVEHHVGNVLAKLGLRSRAEAAAYAVRSPPPNG